MKEKKKFFLLVFFLVVGIGVSENVKAASEDIVSNNGEVKINIPKRNSNETVEPFKGIDVAPVSEPIKVPEEGTFMDESVSPYTIVGKDNRIFVSNTKLYPYRAVCYLVMDFLNGSTYLGSGNLVAGNKVLTAGHNIYSKSDGGWAKRVRVYPATYRNGAGLWAPYGMANSYSFTTLQGWLSEDSEYDAAVLKLDKSIGNTTGTFGYTTGTYNSAFITGYDGDYSGYLLNRYGSIDTIAERKLYYKMDSYAGSSGSGVYYNNYIFGIHAYGHRASNSATRVTPYIFNMVRNF